MSQEMVEVDKPGDERNRQRGAVVQVLAGNRYTVEFYSDGRYSTHIYDGRNLRALITVSI